MLQVSPGLQALPQLPQLLVDACKLAQPDGQQVSPMEQIWPLHLQAPFMHDSPLPHALPQAPQLALSEVRSTQLPCAASQQIFGAAHGCVPQGQLPLLEQPLPAQQRPPAPQSSPPLQAQAPLKQVSPGLQALPQLPQLKGS